MEKKPYTTPLTTLLATDELMNGNVTSTATTCLNPSGGESDGCSNDISVCLADDCDADAGAKGRNPWSGDEARGSVWDEWGV